MPLDFYEEEHRIFRESLRAFVEREMLPNYDAWEKAGQVPRAIWERAGENGFLCFDVPEAYGGLGLSDFRYSMVAAQEFARASGSGAGFTVHTDMIVPYIRNFGTEALKQKYLPGMVAGTCIGAVAMTEPNTGSDLAGVRTTAVCDGDDYIVNGQKTFITNGILNDVVIVVCKTDPGAGHGGISLVLVDRDTPGYERGRNLEKMGMHAQDTAELFFKDCRVPVGNLLGEEGQGFLYLMRQLARERLGIAAGAIGACALALEWTLDYCKERTAFGRPIGSFQNSRFRLAEMKTEIEIGRAFVEQCVGLYNEGALDAERAAMAKWWVTELQKRVMDTCVQLHGGYGFMMEYPIARAYLDTRAQTIYGGTTEIMKEIIGRAMGL